MGTFRSNPVQVIHTKRLNDRWRSPEELEQVSGVPVFGIIPEFEVNKGVKKGKG